MVPVLILFGAVFGRFWAACLVVGAVVWPVTLVVSGTVDPGWVLLGAALVGATNAGVGVLLHQGVRLLLRGRGAADA